MNLVFKTAFDIIKIIFKSFHFMTTSMKYIKFELWNRLCLMCLKKIEHYIV